MGSCFCQLKVQTHTPQLQQEHVLAELQGLLMWAPAARGCKWAVNPSKSIMYLCPNLKLYKPCSDIVLISLYLLYFVFLLSGASPLSASAFFTCSMQNPLNVSVPALRTVLKDTPHSKPLTRYDAVAEMICRLPLILTGGTHLNWPETHRFVYTRK